MYSCDSLLIAYLLIERMGYQMAEGLSTTTTELQFHPRVPMVITPRSTHAGVAQGPYTSPSCTAQPGLGYVEVRKVWGSVPGVVTCACAHVETASAHAGWRVLVGVHCNRQ